jgi:hypothetical protein
MDHEIAAEAAVGRIVSEQEGGSRHGLDQTKQASEQGGLACAVGAEQDKALSGFHHEIDIVQHGCVFVTGAKAAQADGCVVGDGVGHGCFGRNDRISGSGFVPDFV